MAQKTVNVTSVPICNPDVLHVQREDSIIWQGEPHKGQFEGKMLTNKTDNFTDADLVEIVEGDKFPTNLPNWEENQERFVLANAEKGAYKYSVKLKASPGMKRDPIVVVD